MKNKNQINNLILKSPIDALVNHDTKLSPEQLADFKQLITERQLLESDLANALDSRNSQSALIGIAKKAGKPVDEIVNKVKLHSVTINNIKEQIKNINVKILSYFNLESPLINDALKNSSLPVGNPPPPLDNNFDISGVTVSLLDASNADDATLYRLNVFINHQSNTSIYHNFSWQKLIKQSFNHDGYYYIAQNRQDEILGILPLVRLKSFLFGDFLISMPYFNYGGPIAVNNFIEKLLIEKGNGLAADLKVDYVEYRDLYQRNDMPVKSDKVNMILPLESNKDRQWQSFSAKLKSQIRKSKKQGFTVEQGGTELLNDFYNVFSENMRDLGTPVYAKHFFSNILETFKDKATIIIVKSGSKPVSAGFLLQHKDQLEIPWASTLSKYNIKNANMFLYWNIIKYAIHKQCQFFDFGRSSIDSGTYRFKKQWGAKARQSYWHYWLNESIEMPKLNPTNPKFRLVITIWKKLPVLLTNLIGPFIVKNLP